MTRDVVLGRLAGEAPPDLLVCVADATNLRLVLRLVLELKRPAGRWCWRSTCSTSPSARASRIDLERLSAELGVPVVTTVATRRRGIEELLAAVDARRRRARRRAAWRRRDAAGIRAAQREAERILRPP